MADNKASVGRFMGRMVREVPNVFDTLFGKRPPAAPSREEQVAAAEEIVPFEQEWLDAQVAANGQVDDYDRALLDFVAEVSAA